MEEGKVYGAQPRARRQCLATPRSSGRRSTSSPANGAPRSRPSAHSWAGARRPRSPRGSSGSGGIWASARKGIRPPSPGSPPRSSRRSKPSGSAHSRSPPRRPRTITTRRASGWSSSGSRTKCARNPLSCASARTRRAARERERALADSRDHLLSTLRMLESDRVSLRAREARIAELEAQVEDYRQQLARLIARAVAKNRILVDRKTQAPGRRKPGLPARRGPSAKKPRPTLKSRRRARR